MVYKIAASRTPKTKSCTMQKFVWIGSRLRSRANRSILYQKMMVVLACPSLLQKSTGMMRGHQHRSIRTTRISSMTTVATSITMGCRRKQVTSKRAAVAESPCRRVQPSRRVTSSQAETKSSLASTSWTTCDKAMARVAQTGPVLRTIRRKCRPSELK